MNFVGRVTKAVMERVEKNLATEFQGELWRAQSEVYDSTS